MEKTQIDMIKEEAEKAKCEESKKRMIKYKIYNHKTHKIETRERVGKASKSSFKRISILLSIIIIEVAVLIFLITQFLINFLWVLVVFYSIGFIFSLRVAVSDFKSYDSKIAWILFLLVLAPVSVFAYLFAGEITATPIKSRRLKRIDKNTKFLLKTKIPAELPLRVRRDCTYMQNCSDYVPYYNGSCEYFENGEMFFEDVLTKLKTAEKFVFMDFFILEEGQLANAVFRILTERVKAGVDVRIIVDGLGSHGTLSLFKIKRINRAGIKIIPFEPVIPVINLFMNYRDHRKIIVIDGKMGYVGGANIADEYVNAKKKYGLWKDAAMRIDGEAVNSLTLTFLRMWEYSSKKSAEYDKFLINAQSDAKVKGTVIMPYAGGPEQRLKLCKEVYSNIIADTKEKLYIMTPYFIIDRHMIDMIKNKAQSGVDVRIIIPGVRDKKFVYSLSLANVKSMLASKVKVYTYAPGFLHSKVIISDDECAVVGSVNMDFRSFYQQYESATYIAGCDALKKIAADFDKTFEESKEILTVNKRNIFERIWISFLRLFTPLM